jgi:Rrf2 family protein
LDCALSGRHQTTTRDIDQQFLAKAISLDSGGYFRYCGTCFLVLPEIAPMNGILAFSDAASLALHTAGMLAAEPDRLHSVPEMAAALQASPAHLAKVLQSLARAGLVRSTRGPGGGFTLARPPGDMTLLEVYEAVSGTLQPSTCLLRRPSCFAGGCVLGDLLRRVQADVRKYLSQTRVEALASLRFGSAAPAKAASRTRSKTSAEKPRPRR